MTIQVRDVKHNREVDLKVLPRKLIEIKPNKHRVAVFTWQRLNGKLIRARRELSHTLLPAPTWAETAAWDR